MDGGKGELKDSQQVPLSDYSSGLSWEKGNDFPLHVRWHFDLYGAGLSRS